MEKERQHIEAAVQTTDIIILSALVPGEIAPVLITEEMVKKMRPGSVIVDVAIDRSEPADDVIQRKINLSGLTARCMRRRLRSLAPHPA